MSSQDLENLLDIALVAARDAGSAILAIYATDFTVAQKSDRSPVTPADVQAETAILHRLEAATPMIPVVSEERVGQDGLPPLSQGRFWLVDPLDGTREFIGKNGEFTVNIALIEAGRPLLGVVGVPAQGLLYTGAGPGTARRIDAAGKSMPIRCRTCPEDGAILVHSRSHGDAEALDKWAAASGIKVKGRLAAGSALKFCLVAEGSADLYPRLGRTMEWDTAAGQAVLEAAGGKVLQLDGRPLFYGKYGAENPFFVAKSD